MLVKPNQEPSSDTTGSGEQPPRDFALERVRTRQRRFIQAQAVSTEVRLSRQTRFELRVFHRHDLSSPCSYGGANRGLDHPGTLGDEHLIEGLAADSLMIEAKLSHWSFGLNQLARLRWDTMRR
jgi:hypothetical protein